MYKIFVNIFLIIIAVILYLSGCIVSFFGLGYFLLDDSNQWIQNFVDIPIENHWIFATILLISGVVGNVIAITSIFMYALDKKGV